MREMFYNNQKMKEILQDASLAKLRDLMFPSEYNAWITDDDITPEKMSESFRGVGDYAERLNFLKTHIETGEITREKVYPESEVRSDSSKVGVQVLEYRNRGSNKVAIIIPGGGYSNVCSFSEGWPIAQELFERGYNCFVLYYRVFPNAYMPNPIEDVARLVKRIKENYLDLDLNGYLMLGFSAGGHLAGIWATKKGYYRYGLPKPKYIALAYPVIDLSLNKGVSCQNCLHKDCSGEDLIRYSVFTNIDKDYPVTYLWQGKRDQCISFDNSVVMDKVLKENDVKHKYVVYDDTCHGFGVGVGTCAEGWIDKMIKYFESADEA